MARRGSTRETAAPTSDRDDRGDLLSVVELGKDYGSTRAVAEVSFDVRDGETVGLLGRNGAGKSTTINCIVGLVDPTSGVVRFDGREVPRRKRQAHIGYAAQETGVYNMLTVEENLSFLARIRGVPDVDAAVQRMLEEFDLADLAARRAYALSGGQQRRLHLASALVHRPRLLIVDEPTASLDVHARRDVLAVLQARRREGMAILLTTHLLHEAAELCDRLVVIDRGRVCDQGTPDEIIARHAEASVTVTVAEGYVADGSVDQVGTQVRFHGGGDAQVLARQALEWAVNASAPIEDITVLGATLEAAFLSLTATDDRDSETERAVAP
jgi:heme ABC exporter ATP-binding subunit CcmA